MGLRNVLRARQNIGLPQQLAKAGGKRWGGGVGGVIRRRGASKQRTVGQVEANISDYNTVCCKRDRKGEAGTARGSQWG